MKILVIGGTVFLGRHIVAAALEAGHEVTLFNRGQHNPDLFPDVEKLRGDRNGDLSALVGRTWEAAIDPSAYFPRQVRTITAALAGSVGHYTLISSISVYPDFGKIGQNEGDPIAVGKLADETIEEINGETYGPLKVLCEQAAEAAFPETSLIVRPGLIVGPHDPTDRFTYWPHRVAQGGEVLVPGRPEREVQFIDVRDLAEWTVRSVAVGRTGVYNTNGPEYKLRMQTLIEECQKAGNNVAQINWRDGAFLLENGVTSWSELPVWAAEEQKPEMAGFFKFDCRKAIAAGLTFRPLAETVRDTLAWDATRSPDGTFKATLKPEREAELLGAVVSDQ